MARYLPRLLLFCTFVAAACAHASMSGVTEAGARVEVGKGDPPKEMTELGAFEAADPPACAAGQSGSYDGALVELRNTAGRLGADYVQIFRTDTDPCGRTIIRAMAFRRPAGDAANPAN
jgi:hypothetical protein